VLAAGRPAEAADLRARAFDVAPAIPGTINGTPFEWIADADMRLGPVLEIIVNGRYFWAPFGAIHKLEIDPPTDLRDRAWTPAHVVWSNGGDAVALIPTRYPGTTATTDDALRLARMTTWEDAGAETYVGLGGRLLATDAGDTALMDLRQLVIGDAPESAATDAAGEGADG